MTGSNWVLALLIFSAQGVASAGESPQGGYAAGQRYIESAERLRQNTSTARNVILFIGDGMGVSTVTAARILEGQLRGQPGEENVLSFEKLPYVALSKTYNTNLQTPDSAGTMSAMITGVKTKAGFISVDQTAVRGDCASSTGAHLKTFLELAEESGKSTGVVSTARLTHATPAATYAHTSERAWESDRKLSNQAREQGCKDIAWQLLEFPYGDGLEVAMGGGRREFLPQTQADPENAAKTGLRGDGRDLTAEWQAKYANSAYVWNLGQFESIDPLRTDHLLALFSWSHMNYEVDRAADKAGEPSLSQMTRKAIEILARNERGFFLMVEAGRIDHAHHAGNAYRALHDTIELARAVETAQQLVGDDTLIIVTADHSHVFTMAGYATRGNPILGKVVGNDARGEPKSTPELAADGKPYTTLSYANGRGFARLKKGGDTHYGKAIAAGRTQDLSRIDTGDQGFHQQALVPLPAETHGGEDVAIYATGPGAHLLHGVVEQNVIFHLMRHATGLDR